MTRQNKHQDYCSPVLRLKKSREESKLISERYLTRGSFSLNFASSCLLAFCFSNASLAQTLDLPKASDIDWVNLEDLSPKDQAKVIGDCCGLYIEPELPAMEELAGSTSLTSDGSATSDNTPGSRVVTLEGNVEIRQDQRLIQTEKVIYNIDSETLDLSGGIKIREPGILMVGTDALLDQSNKSTQLNNASFVLHQEKIRGSAEIIVYTDADGIVTIDNGLYTRCEPGDSSWMLSAGKIILDQEKGRGVVKNVTIKVKGVPIFYSPHFSFPLNDERATGFLAPTFGSTSVGGIDISIPFYLNLAPNYDATITPRLITNRGLMTNIEGRYRGKRSTNIINMSYLGNDKLFDEDSIGLPGSDSPPVLDRWLIDYDYRARFGKKWDAAVDYSEVSDKDYFIDLGDIGLDTSTKSYLSRKAHLRYRGNNWNFTTSAQSYQVIDPTVTKLNQPYDSLPRLNLDGRFDNDLGIQYGLNTEYIFFDRDLNRDALTQGQINQGALVTGQRLAIEPAISWPWRTPGTFVIPTAKYKYATYQLKDQNLNIDDRQSRGIFMASLDSGLVFERDFKFGSRDFIQTLEPRVFYLYSEYVDQADIPVFDSADMTFSFSQLFRENRFSGKDRIGDSNQLTIALSSNFFNQRGRKKASASIGQIYYLDDRIVTLKNRTSPSLLYSGSATVAELSYKLNANWLASSYVEWNTNTHSMDAGNVQFRYQSDFNHIFNLSYRYRDQINPFSTTGLDLRTKQTDVSGIWPVHGNWSLIARWNYDHANERNLESIVGIEYDTCCWNVRVVGREWIDQDDLKLAEVDTDTGIFFQFELKGLGSLLGANVSSFLSNGIEGYREHEYAR